MTEILYDDKQIVVFIKPVGVLSEPCENESESVFSRLTEEYGYRSLFLVHRLDRNVSGAMVLAKSKAAAGKLSTFIAERSFEKEYIAVVHGVPAEKSGVYKDLLFKDRSTGKSYVVDRMRKGVKDASLEYCLIKSTESEDGILSLVRIKLHTGRTHQIRVQFSSRGTPLYGDGKYGSHTNRGFIGLFSARLSFKHPTLKGKEMDITALPDTDIYPWSLFKDCISKDLFKLPVLSLGM